MTKPIDRVPSTLTILIALPIVLIGWALSAALFLFLLPITLLNVCRDILSKRRP